MMIKQEQQELYPSAPGQAPQQPQYQYQTVSGYGAAPGGVPASLPMQQPGMQPLMPAAPMPGYDPMALLNGAVAPAGVAGIGAGGVPVPGAVAGAPAGMSTAESNVRGMSYMTNGAPVLVRGGGGGAGAQQLGGGLGGVGLNGIPGMVGANNTMPAIKLEGGGGLTSAPMAAPLTAGGGGMIPIDGGLQNNGHQVAQQQQQQTQHMQPGMMMPIDNKTGGVGVGMLPSALGAPPTTSMVPAPGLELQQQQQQNQQHVRIIRSLDDLLGEIPSELGADGTVISPTAKNERKQQILKQQRWLLFLRHCARCTLEDTECPYGSNCGVAKQLWQHLIHCKSETCTYPRCSPSRALLRHHQRCKSSHCPVCAPVKQYVAKQREAILRKKLDASGFSMEQQARYVEQVRARRAQGAQASAAANSGAGPSSSSAYGGGAPIVDPQAVKRPRIMLHENMKTSLIEFFNALDIRKHIQLVHLDGQNDTSARKPPMMASYDLFGSGFQEEESCCKVCHRNKMTFEPPTLYCDSCGQRIKRNQTYHATPKQSEIRGLYCNQCMASTQSEYLQPQSFSMRKADMEKKRNDDEQEEAWVQCDNCEGWVHQICGLFNKGRNNEERGFLCPPCLLNGLESGHRSVPAERPQAMLTAKDLPRCQLSDFLENRLQQSILRERVARAKATGRPVEEIKSAEGLCVRIVNNVTKKMEVKPNFAKAFATGGSVYPDAASYKQKVVLLFQHQDGVDMCLFCLYLQEYGDDCAPPNNRVVHVSYLDSIKYFQPEKMSAAGMGVALRTMVYHDILLGYFQYAKSLGYCALHIWACPPMAGDDYILYCHPGKQKIPRSDRLREWYLTMLRRGKNEGIITHISNLLDTYFEGGKDHRIERPSILELPYLDGDYWPGEAENLLSNLDDGNGGFDVNKGGNGGQVKGRKSGKDKRWKPSHPDATLAEKVLGRLGETIQGMREDFIVAHLYENCSHCRCYIDDDVRYYHPNPPQKVTIKSERTFDGIALDKPGAESSRTVTLTRFQLCSECYNRECGQDPAGRKPLGIPSGIALTDLISEPCPKIPSTKETVPQIDNDFFDTRNLFLSLCQGNHYQFDTARRARHSSMMVLYHLHNPSEPAFTSNCSVCQTELKPGEGYRCLTCTDFDMCTACHASPAVTHPHQLVLQATRKFDETRMRLTDEDRMKRDETFQRTMTLLVHASDCRSTQCLSSNCAKVKALFNHAVNCTVKITGGCAYCRRMWALLQAHSKMCIAAECPVPRCRELRALRRQQAARQEDQRRAAYRKMLIQQQASAE